jgi:CBS domain-containing protein
MLNKTTIDHFMTRRPSTVSPDESLDSVRRIFEIHGFHHVPVVEAGKLAGIVSYTDYLRIISEMCSGNTPAKIFKTSLANIAVHEIMTKAVVCLKPGDTVAHALSVFRKQEFHAMPVVDPANHLLGILSTHDLMKVLEKTLASEIDYASRG